MYLELSTDQKDLVAELAARYADAGPDFRTCVQVDHADGFLRLRVDRVAPESDPEAGPATS